MFDFDALPVVDNHTHPYLVSPVPRDRRYAALDTFLGTPGDGDEALEHRNAMLYQRLATRMLARFLGCEPTPQAVAEVRAKERDERAYVERLFADARIEALVVDTGYPQPAIPLDAFRARTPVPVWPIFRIEPVIASLLNARLPFEDWVHRFDGRLRRAVQEEGYVGFKSIIAYRTGLEIDLAHRGANAGQRAFDAALAEPDRLSASKPLRDFLLLRTLELAIELGVPVQIHTGFGDIDILLKHCNPAGLADALKDEVYRAAKVVLVHCYPFVAEASYLAAALPNVWCDLSLGVPFAPAAADRIYATAFELAPVNRILTGSDAFSGPEQSWLGAKIAKAALGRVLTDFEARGLVDEVEAYQIAADVLAGNARALYGTG